MIKVYAHRGASAEAPENTLPAFERALALGADALELDVHATQDGVVIVSHDPDGGRVAGVGKNFAQVFWREVSSWDAGYGFRAPDGSRPFMGKSLRVLQLEELLEAFPETPLNIDLKAPIADLVVPLIKKHQAEHRVCLASFQDKTLQRVRSLGYQGPTSLGPGEAKRALLLPVFLQQGPLQVQARAAQLPVRYATPWVIGKLRALGLTIDFWTINQPEEAQRVARLGVDGIMTDDPRAVVPAIRALSL